MKWEDPPRPPGKGGPPVRWLKEAEELRSHPNRWAVFITIPVSQKMSASRWVNSIKLGYRRAFKPAGSFEALQHQDGDVIKIYARYVGEEK